MFILGQSQTSRVNILGERRSGSRLKGRGYILGKPPSSIYYKSYKIPIIMVYEASIKQLNLLISNIIRSLPLLSLPALNKHNRALVVLPGANKVVDHAEHGNTDEHDGRPVEGVECSRCALWPETPEEGVDSVQQTSKVDGDTPLAERPGADRKSLRGGDAAVEDGADGENVGDHKGDNVERDDCDVVSGGSDGG